MSVGEHSLETDIAEWRAFVAGGPGVGDRDIDELEDHLRAQVADLTEAGLTPDEAFLIAVKRLGGIDDLSREYAREHSGRLWRQLVLSEEDSESPSSRSWRAALAFALGAAAVVQGARLAAGFPEQAPGWLARNLSLLVLPFLAGYFIRLRRLGTRHIVLTTVLFATAAVVINLYPFAPAGSTESLVAAHLPIAGWFVVAYAYTGGVLSSHERRMDFVRFTGEWVIYYALIALGGGVLTALSVAVLEPTGIVNAERVVEWVLPSGAAGAVVIAAWLVEAKQRVVENMAPVLTMVFMPLFGVMLVVAVAVYAATVLGDVFDRELLGVFDALLVVVLGLVLYGISARDAAAPPGWMDRFQLVTVVAALALDSVVLGTMVARVGDLGFTPNRTVALGLNVVLLVSLVGTAWLSVRFTTGQGTFHRLERWQTTYLPAFAAWAAAVVMAVPPLFGFT